MISAMFVFAIQDGISRHLAETYNTITVVMIRYWFFAAFVITLSLRHSGGLRKVATTHVPAIQIFRGVLLAVEIVVTVVCFVLLGLVETHAIFACYPLLVAALSGPILGETVGWRRWSAIIIGFVGVLIILRPGLRVFDPAALIALTAALLFALYGLLTRYVAKFDRPQTSFFYTGVAGAVAITCVGPFFWEPMQTTQDWMWMGLLCCTGALGHYLLIRAFDLSEASAIQPFAFFQLFFASLVGVLVFSEHLDPVTVFGASIILSAGLYTLWRERLRAGSDPG